MIDTGHLAALRALEEAGNITAAARQLHITQPALSHRLRALEEYCGARLFERRTQPPVFTPVGRRLLQLAQDIEALMRTAENDIAELSGSRSGELRVAVECHTCFEWLMPAMDVFREHWPLVELDIVSGFQADPVSLLLSRRADLAIVSENVPQKDITVRPLFSYEMVGICAADSPLADKPVWEATDFAGQTLITYPVSDDMLDLIRKILAPAGVNPPRRHSELTVAIVQLVASRRGIAALPYWAVMSYLEKGLIVARQIGQSGLSSELFAAVRAEDARRPFMEHFCRIVRECSLNELPGITLLD